MLSPVLDWYIDECMVSIMNIDNGFKEPTRGYQNYNTSQILIFGGYVKVRESLYTWVIFEPLWTIVLGRFCLRITILAWYMDPNGIENKNIVKYPYPSGIKKMWKPQYRYPNGTKKDDTRPTLVTTLGSCVKWP